MNREGLMERSGFGSMIIDWDGVFFQFKGPSWKPIPRNLPMAGELCYFSRVFPKLFTSQLLCEANLLRTYKAGGYRYHSTRNSFRSQIISPCSLPYSIPAPPPSHTQSRHYPGSEAYRDSA